MIVHSKHFERSIVGTTEIIEVHYAGMCPTVWSICRCPAWTMLGSRKNFKLGIGVNDNLEFLSTFEIFIKHV
jgi:hypothetical protein